MLSELLVRFVCIDVDKFLRSFVCIGTIDNLTTCPRLLSEVESVMAGGQWPPAIDAAPYLHRRWVTLAPGGANMIPLTLGEKK